MKSGGTLACSLPVLGFSLQSLILSKELPAVTFSSYFLTSINEGAGRLAGASDGKGECLLKGGKPQSWRHE